MYLHHNPATECWETPMHLWCLKCLCSCTSYSNKHKANDPMGITASLRVTILIHAKWGRAASFARIDLARKPSPRQSGGAECSGQHERLETSIMRNCRDGIFQRWVVSDCSPSRMASHSDSISFILIHICRWQYMFLGSSSFLVSLN